MHRFELHTVARATCLVVALAATASSAVAQQPVDPTSSVPAAASPEALVEFNIPRQPLGTALEAFALQTGWQIAYASRQVDVSGLSTELRGKMRPREALDRLLGAAPRLSYTLVGDRSVMVQSSADKVERLEAVVVVGSNLKGHDKALPVTVIDAEQIQRMGYSSVEEILRRLPQNLSSVTATGVMLGQGEFGRVSRSVSPLGATGINLRGLGSRSTLVLVNGRRQAGSAQDSGEYTDISSIPVSMIERIEILNDGASAIYGADAVAGVVNIILKDGYSGTLLQARYEHAGSGAHVAKLSAGHTFSIRGLSLTVTGNYEKHEIGLANAYTIVGPGGRGDFSHLGGANLRTPWLGQPGVVFSAVPNPENPRTMKSGEVLGFIPAGQNGTGLTLDKLLRPSSNPYERSFYAPPATTPEKEMLNLAVSGSVPLGAHKLEASLRLGSQTSKRRYQPDWMAFGIVGTMGQTFLPASGKNNPFGRPVFVAYTFEEELKGLDFRNDSANTNVAGAIGLSGSLGASGWTYDVALSHSQEDSRTKLFDAASAPNSERPAQRRRAARVLAAINLLTDGKDPAVIAQNRALLNTLVDQSMEESKSDSTVLDVKLNRMLYQNAQGQNLQLALGGQSRYETMSSSSDKTASTTGRKRTAHALFFELGSVLAKDTAWAKDVTASIAGRYERFHQRGQSDLSNYAALSVLQEDESYVDVDLLQLGGFNVTQFTGYSTTPKLYESLKSQPMARTYSNFSPVFRLSWAPNDSVRLRGTVGRSFLTPGVQDQFGSNVLEYYNGMLESSKTPLPVGVTSLVAYNGPNPDLKPQIAHSYTLGMDFMPAALPGLKAGLTYVHTQYNNYIGDPAEAGKGIGDLLSNLDKLPKDSYVIKNGVMLWDIRSINFAKRVQRSLDVNASYSFSSGSMGDWIIDLAGTFALENSNQTKPWMPKYVYSNSEFGPAPLKGYASVNWLYNSWSVTATVNHIHGHRVLMPYTLETSLYNPKPNPNPQRHARATQTVDLQVAYAFERPAGWGKGLTLTVGAQNVFDKKPVFVDNISGFVASHYDSRGRVVYLSLNKQF